MSDLQQRVITALVLVSVSLSALYYIPWLPFNVILLIVALMIAHEWSNLVAWQHQIKRPMMMTAVAVVSACCFFLPHFPILLVGTFVTLWYFTAVLAYQFLGSSLSINRASVSFVLGVLSLVTFVKAVDFLRGHGAHGSLWIFYPIFLSMAVDTSGYLIGRSWGSHKLIPKVSPKKSWEGLIAGFFVGMLLSVFASFLVLPSDVTRGYLICLSFFCLVASVFGDLSISLLKRLANVKDSGNLLPGHGGLLDRFDSIMPCMLVFAFGLVLATH